TEPPDDLPPGAAGTLIDEHVDHHDVVATLLGLARHGAITIQEQRPDNDRATGARSDYLLTVVDPDGVTSRLERDLLRVLFNGKPVSFGSVLLSAVKRRFDAHEPEIRADLYQEIVDRKYFARSPEATRRRWRSLSWFGLAGSIPVGLFLTVLVDPFAILPTIAALLIWLVMLRLSRAMPRKTRIGAEAAAKWRAFKRYLESIDRHENLAEARELFDRYLSYAVAFGLERHWLASFASVGAPSPGWFVPVGGFGDGDFDGAETIFDTMQAGRMIGHFGGLGGSDVNVPDVGAPNVDMPNLPDGGLQDVADTFGGGLQDASDGLGGLLDSAGSVFDSIDIDFDF
ncbi:MAG TPA: DUF2207 domain-containing protein, partial [Thermomicrobiales bacterium]|nr:DUF2207 domain-containing protein [Thermomicrobiales bacterium]